MPYRAPPRIFRGSRQGNQHKCVTNTHQEVGTEGKQSPLPPIVGLPLVLVVVVATRRGLVTLVVVMFRAFVRLAFMTPIGIVSPVGRLMHGPDGRLIVVMAIRVTGNDVAAVGVRRRLGSILIHLALKN
jgi:hypothetical protein